MKPVQCKDCLWCESTFLMEKYFEVHTFCRFRSSLFDKPLVSHKVLTVNPDTSIVQLNLFDL